jgi:hypothetical protein
LVVSVSAVQVPASSGSMWLGRMAAPPTSMGSPMRNTAAVPDFRWTAVISWQNFPTTMTSSLLTRQHHHHIDQASVPSISFCPYWNLEVLPATCSEQALNVGVRYDRVLIIHVGLPNIVLLLITELQCLASALLGFDVQSCVLDTTKLYPKIEVGLIPNCPRYLGNCSYTAGAYPRNGTATRKDSPDHSLPTEKWRHIMTTNYLNIVT